MSTDPDVTAEPTATTTSPPRREPESTLRDKPPEAPAASPVARRRPLDGPCVASPVATLTAPLVPPVPVETNTSPVESEAEPPLTSDADPPKPSTDVPADNDTSPAREESELLAPPLIDTMPPFPLDAPADIVTPPALAASEESPAERPTSPPAPDKP